MLPDLAGFGRSDKPIDPDWYSYDRHVAVAATLLEDLDLRGATFVVHDWGGPIGLRLAVEHRERVDRLVMMDTGLFTGRQQMSEAWHTFAAVRAPGRGAADRLPRAPRLPRRPRRRGRRRLRRAVPERGLEGRRARVPGADPARAPRWPGAEAGQRTLDALREDTRPMLMLWGREDPALPPAVGEAFAAALGRPAPRLIDGAGHFLQEDRGEEVGALIADWLRAS